MNIIKTLEFISKGGLSYVGVGGAMITVGIVTSPAHPIVGGALIVGGCALEVKDVYEFIDWAKRYGASYNKIRAAQEEY